MKKRNFSIIEQIQILNINLFFKKKFLSKFFIFIFSFLILIYVKRILKPFLFIKKCFFYLIRLNHY